MTTLAILHPAHLLGEELKGELEKRRHLWDRLLLLSDDEEEVGHLTEVAREAAVVRRLDPGDLDSVAVAFFCGGIEAERPLLATVPPETTAIVLSPDAALGDGLPAVAGVGGGGVEPGQVLVSPHPGAVLLTHLLAPLLALQPERAVATVTQPASLAGKEGLDELFEQTRAILTFSTERPEAIFGRQLAFNHYPPEPSLPPLAPVVQACLGDGLPLGVRVLQGGSFHGISASLWVRFADDPGPEALRQALAASPRLELTAEGEPEPSLVEAANREEILVGAIRAEAGDPGAFWLWAVMDNLTVGSAINAVDLAEAALGAAKVV